jgi:hypothetical protein
VAGNGEQDLVFLLGLPTHVGLMWENPALASFLHGLAAFSRLILLDHQGTGMSDRGPTGRPFEDQMDDVHTVLRATASQRTASTGPLGKRVRVRSVSPFGGAGPDVLHRQSARPAQRRQPLGGAGPVPLDRRRTGAADHRAQHQGDHDRVIRVAEHR